MSHHTTNSCSSEFGPTSARPNPIAAMCENSIACALVPPTINGVSTIPNFDVKYVTNLACNVGKNDGHGPILDVIEI